MYTDEEFKDQVRKMRYWQKRFFKFKFKCEAKKEAFQKSKEYETNVDNMLEEIENPKIF